MSSPYEAHNDQGFNISHHFTSHNSAGMPMGFSERLSDVKETSPINTPCIDSPFEDMAGKSEAAPEKLDGSYAKLITKALMSVEDHTMELCQLYDWFRKHTAKATGDDGRGMENSIRHNLSLNKVFINSLTNFHI